MTRLPGAGVGRARKVAPDIYAVLLIVGILFLLTACVMVCVDLTQNYGLSFADLFKSTKGLPK